jgi:3-oxoacyl-[acyl-carrier-protein] synthase II
VTRRPAKVTGVGPVSALGSGAADFFGALVAGKSGLGPLTRCPPTKRGCAVAAEVAEPPARPFDRRAPMPRGVELALAAARLAADDAALDGDRDRFGVVVGTALGNLDLIEGALAADRAGERCAPATAFRSFAHAAACEIASALDLRGPVATVTSGCNAGIDAIGLALDWIRLGRADAVVVGGAEAELTPAFLTAMSAARALAVRYNDRPEAASRPFDTGRDGNVPGEGAGFLVLESVEHAAKRQARVRGQLLGYASRAAGHRKAYDPFDPIPDPEPMLRGLRAALHDAVVAAPELAAISANGSSSVFYDLLEAEALRTLVGDAADTMPVWSMKGALGQTGAVTSALQTISAVLAAQHRLLPPTVNADDLDPKIRLRIVRGEAHALAPGPILCNAIGFGGYYYSAAVVGPA